MRATALTGGAGRVGLGAALLVTKGMAAWIRGWRACTPPPPPPPTATVAPSGPPVEVIGVLAAMALACAQGG